MKPRSLPLLIVLLCAGCNLAPTYVRPPVDTGGGFKEAVHGPVPEQEGWQLAEPRDATLRGNWWEMYQDLALNELEERVVVSNQNVLAAEANYRAARALVQQAQAQWFPTLSLNPAFTREKSSAAVQSFSGGTGAASSTTTTGATGTTGTPTTGATTAASVGTGTTPSARSIWSLPLEASYQVDLWGSIRNTVAEDRFAALASAATLANALLSTQATLAQDYFQVRIADEERRILDETLADFETNLHLVQTLYKNGLDSEEDVAQAQTQLQSAQAQATDLGVTRATYEHAIAVLIGVPPASFSLPYARFNQSLPKVPVTGVPTDLIERRPDIAVAERQVQSTNAAIGVARAAYFPQLNLTGEVGYEALSLGQLFKSPNLFWSVGPALAQTVFDGGLRRAVTAQARAQNDSAIATYRQTVLSAVQAVEDNLASLRILQQEVDQDHAAAESARRAVSLSVVRFKTGVDSYVNVITAQNSFLTAREAEIQVRLRQFTASINLVNNLGGGWSAGDVDADARRAQRPPPSGQPLIPASDAGPGVPNPPALPPREINPDSLLQDDQNAMGGVPPAPGKPATP